MGTLGVHKKNAQKIRDNVAVDKKSADVMVHKEK
jgi:hypothetical protein